MRISLLIIILLAYALRLYRLDAQSLWYDEGVTATIAQLSFGDLTRWTANDIQPPLYYTIVALWGRVAGWSEWSLRFVSAFFGTISIPLMAVLILRLTDSINRKNAIIAALFTALHPLLIYYSQEARMYTLLTALALITAYALLRYEDRKFSWLYIIAATAAIYTHYFAFFLLLALAIAYLIEKLSKKPSLQEKIRFLCANLLILLCYLPWFAVMFNRLSVDNSYWQGQLKFWEALHHIGTSFVSGETVITEQVQWLLILYGICSLYLLYRVWHNRKQNPRLLTYTLPWLIIPIAGLLLLASFIPKFNARYAMLALPSLLLLWSAAYSDLRFRIFDLRMWCGLLMICGFSYADYNWFYDVNFTKDQWRELSSYVREQQTDDSNTLVILVSGHTWPVWDYYAPDMPALHLPEIDILDVDAVVDLAESAEPLRAALADKSDVWLVGWQDEIVDPMDIIPTQLELAGWEKSVRPKFWGPTLRHFIWLDVDALESRPAAAEMVNFDNRILLLNHAVTNTGDLVLFWQVDGDVQIRQSDLHLIVKSFTKDGLLQLGQTPQQRLAGYAYPSYRWQPSQHVMSRIPARDWTGGGALPDRYQLRVSLYDEDQTLTILDSDAMPQGEEAIRDVALHVSIPASQLTDMAQAMPLVADMLSAQATATVTQAEPSQPWYLTMHWAVHQEPGDKDFDLYIRWLRQDNGQIQHIQRHLLAPNFPTNRWDDDDEVLRTFTPMNVPAEMPPGEYWLDIHLVDADLAEPFETALGNGIRLPMTVLPSTRLFQPPSLGQQIDVTFGNEITLLGLSERPPNRLAIEEPLDLTLAWQATTVPMADYSVTVQFLDAAGRPASQADLPLPDGASSWLAGQVQMQEFTITAPPEPGDYRVIVALYDASRAGFPRLVTPVGDDFVSVGRVEIGQ